MRAIATAVKGAFVFYITSADVYGTVVVPAERTMTQNKMAQFQMALRYYFAEYGQFPKGDVKNIFAILGGQDVDGQNTRQIVFYEYRKPKKFLLWTTDQGDFDEQGRFLDGWGRPFQFGIAAEGFPIRIRSLGKNGRDDNGLSDDRELVIMPSLPQAPTPTPTQQLPPMIVQGSPQYQNAVRWYLVIFLGTIMLFILAVFTLLMRRRS